MNGETRNSLWRLAPWIAIVITAGSMLVGFGELKQVIEQQGSTLADTTSLVIRLADNASDRDRVLVNEIKTLATGLAVHQALDGHETDANRRAQADVMLRDIYQRLTRVEASLEADQEMKVLILDQLKRLTEQLDRRGNPFTREPRTDPD